MNRFVTLFLILATLAVLFSCSGGGGSHDDAGVSALAPTVAVECGISAAAPCPEMVECRAYANPAGRPITVDAFWREKLNLCCGFRLCEVAGECRFSCPPDLRDARCPGAR